MIQTLPHWRPTSWSLALHSKRPLSISARSFPPQGFHTCWSLNLECSFARMTSSYLKVTSSATSSPTILFNQISPSLPGAPSPFSVFQQQLCFLRNTYHSSLIFLFIICLRRLAMRSMRSGATCLGYSQSLAEYMAHGRYSITNC